MTVGELGNITIFHIGNIANNAYNAAAYERQLGLNSYAISPDYTHVMGYPFWETEIIQISPKDTFLGPKISNDSNTPEWFISGSWEDIYSTIKKSKNSISPKENQSNLQNRRYIKRLNLAIQKSLFAKVDFAIEKHRALIKKILPRTIRHKLANSSLMKTRFILPMNFAEIFDSGDILVFYGAYNAYPIIWKWKGSFISLEHGTLRDYIFSNTYFAEQSKLGYQRSYRVLVTNQDCYEPAIKLGIKKSQIVKTPHPSSDFDFQELRERRLERMGSFRNEIIWPTRHSYASIVDRGKGNEEGIRALLKVLQEHQNLKVVFVEWGDDVQISKKLIEDLGMTSQVEWIGVLSRKALKIRMADALVVLDQFTIPAYGGITADALGIGVPVITRREDSTDIDFFGSIGPVLPASNSDEIRDQLNSIILNRSLDREIFAESIKWYELNLSSDIAFSRRKKAYLDFLQEEGKMSE